MADQSRKTTQLPVKAGANSTGDLLVFVYNPNNVTAQTALISIGNVFANTPGLRIVNANLQMNLVTSAPANSTTFTLAQGTLFFDTQYGYLCTSNNHVKRWALSDF